MNHRTEEIVKLLESLDVTLYNKDMAGGDIIEQTIKHIYELEGLPTRAAELQVRRVVMIACYHGFTESARDVLWMAVREMGYECCTKCEGRGTVYPTRAICGQCQGLGATRRKDEA